MTLPSKGDILDTLKAVGHNALLAHDLLAKMGVGPEDTTRFLRLLRSMESEGLVYTRNGRVMLPERAGIVSGRLDVSPRGHGIILADSGTKWHVAKNEMAGAIHGDIVLARSRRSSRHDREASIEKVLRRTTTSFTGIYRQHRGYGEVKPDEPRLNFSMFVANRERATASDGDRVVALIERYPEPGRDARGKITRVIGRAGDPGVDIRAVALRFGFELEFSDAVLSAAEEAATPVTQEHIRERLDLRDKLVFTIDSDDAKDFDDAVSLEKTPGGLRLGVHISDVSSYVKPKTLLDRAAYSRATSVYLDGLVLPMLPPALSDGVASLLPCEDRLAISTFITFDECGNESAPQIARSVIRSKARLTYACVNEFFDSGRVENLSIEGLPECLVHMRTLAKSLAEARTRRGSLDFDFKEFRVDLNDAGEPTNVYAYRRGDAERLIEEFMIKTNEAIAAHMFNAGIPCMYRVHERPEKASLEELNMLLEPLGYRLKGTQNAHPKAIQAVLSEARGKPEEARVNDIVLRSLKKARYSPVWLGHFGLASSRYCHFTSPIRRYPDLLVHRVLGLALDGRLHGDSYKEAMDSLAGAAEHCSEREALAEMAERESLALMKIRYMQSKLGEVFPGVISQVMSYGLFIEIENGVSGLAHISALGDDRFEYDEARRLIYGLRSGKVYKEGQSVYVQVSKVDPVEQRVDLTVVRY